MMDIKVHPAPLTVQVIVMDMENVQLELDVYVRMIIKEKIVLK
jgi:hypothetical protein